MSNFTGRRNIATIFALAWMLLVMTLYYERVWKLFFLDPADWFADNPSLIYLAHTLRVLLASGLDGWNIINIKEALTRAVISMLGAVLVWVAASTLGASLCTLIKCRFDNWIEGVIFHSGIGFGALSYITLGMAMMGIYYPSYVRQLVVAIAAIGIILFLLRFRIPDMRLHARTLLIEMRPWKASIWHVIVLLALAVALLGSLAPEIEYDALWYHLWLPRLWLEQGTPVDLVSEYISLYPLTWELAYGAGMVMGGPIAAKLLNFICLLLTAGLIYQAVRCYAAQASPWVAIAIWITAPTVLWEATTAYVDLSLGFFSMLVVFSVLRYMERKEIKWMVLAGISVGFAMGIKHLALIILMLVSIGLAVKLWFCTRKLKEVFLPLTILVGLGLLIAFPWYLRSWQASRNPVFPELFNVFGAQPPQRWDGITDRGLDEYKAHFGRPRTLSNLVSLPWDMTFHAASYGGSLGPLFLILVPVLMLFRNRMPVLPWFGWLALLYILFWASPFSSFQMRFLVPVIPLLAVLGAEGYEQLGGALGSVTGISGKRLLGIGVSVICLLNLPPFTSLHELDRVGWEGWLTHVIHKVPLEVVLGAVTEAEYLNQMVPSHASWMYIESHLPNDSRILTFSGGDHFYSHRQRIPGDSTIARQVVRVTQDEHGYRLLEQLNLLGVTHILFDKKGMVELSTWNLTIVEPEIISRWYLKEYEDSSFILYRLLQP